MFNDLLGLNVAPLDNKSKQIKSWARKHWALPESSVVFVSELQCGETNCPDVETVIAVLEQPGSEKKFKLYKSLSDINEEDIANITCPT